MFGFSKQLPQTVNSTMVSAKIAKTHAEQEFTRFRVIDDMQHESDFDKMVKQLLHSKKKPS